MSVDLETTLVRFFEKLNQLENACVQTDSDSDYEEHEEDYSKEVLKRLQNAKKLTEHIRTWATKIEELGRELEKKEHAKLWLQHINSKLISLKYNSTTTPEEITQFLEDTIVYSKNYIVYSMYGINIYYVDAIEYFMQGKTTPEWIEWERTQRAKQPEFLTELEKVVSTRKGITTLSFDKETVSEYNEKKENIVGSDSYNINLRDAKHLIDAWIFNVDKINLVKPKYEPPESYSKFMPWVLSQLRRIIKLVCTCSIRGYFSQKTSICIRYALKMPQFKDAADIIDEFVKFCTPRICEYMKENRMSMIQKKYVKNVFTEWSKDKSSTIEKYPFLQTSFVLKQPTRTKTQLNLNIYVWQIGPSTQEYENDLKTEMQIRQAYIDALYKIDGKDDLSIEVKNEADSNYVSKEFTDYFEKIIVVPQEYIDSYVD